MRQFFVCLLAGLSLQGLSAQINFVEAGTWAAAQEKAKADKKLIFVDVYAEWCGPCKWMSKNAFMDKEVGEFFNKHFVSVKIDAEKGDGVRFASQHQVNAYPTLLFFNAEGEMVHKALGARDAAGLIKEGQKAGNPESQISSLHKKYEAGERSQAFLKTYLESLLDGGEDAKAAEVSGHFWETLGEAETKTKDNIFLMARSTNSLDAPWFNWALNNEATLVSALGKDMTEQYIESVLHMEIERIVEKVSEKDLALEEKRLQTKLGKKRAPAAIADLRHHYYMGNEAKSFKYTKAYMDKHCNNLYKLNEIAWVYYERETDKKKLQAALNWIDRSLALGKYAFNMDTKAALLFKLGRYKEAKAAAEMTIALAVSDQEKEMIVPGTKELLEKINAALEKKK